MNSLGRVSNFLSDKHDEAKRLFEEVLYHIRNSFLVEKMHIDIAAVLSNTGQVHFRLGDIVQKALTYYHDCLKIMSTNLGNDHPEVIQHLLLEIGGIYIERERFNLAMEYYTHALSEWCSSCYNKKDIQENPDSILTVIQMSASVRNAKICRINPRFVPRSVGICYQRNIK